MEYREDIEKGDNRKEQEGQDRRDDGKTECSQIPGRGTKTPECPVPDDVLRKVRINQAAVVRCIAPGKVERDTNKEQVAGIDGKRDQGKGISR